MSTLCLMGTYCAIWLFGLGGQTPGTALFYKKKYWISEFLKKGLITATSKWLFPTKMMLSHSPSLRSTRKYQEKNISLIRCNIQFFIRNHVFEFSHFFRTEAYNKPLKITFSHRNYFFPLTQYQIDWKIPTTKILRKLGAVHIFL